MSVSIASGVSAINPNVSSGSLILGSAKASPQLRRIASALMPSDIVIVGDSTSDESTEWGRLLASLFSVGVGKNHTVVYRQWSDARQQYATTQEVAIGPLGRRYISAGSAATSHRIEVTTSAVTGDLTVIVGVGLEGGSPSSQFAICGHGGEDGNRAWRLELTTGNQIFFGHTATGLQANEISRTFTALNSTVLNASFIWLRLELDVNDGSGNNVATLSTSSDRVTWTTVGTSSLVGTTSIFNSTATMQFVGRYGGNISSLGKNFRFYAMEVFASLTEADMRASVDCGVIPTQTSAATPYSTSFNDDTGRASTVTYNASTLVGSPRLCFFNGSVGGTTISYASDPTRYTKLFAGTPSFVLINYSHNETSDVDYAPNYTALTDLIEAEFVSAAIYPVLQNKRYSPATFREEHEIRLQQIAVLAGSKSWGLVDHYSYVSSGYMKADGIHPDPATGIETVLANVTYNTLTASGFNYVNPG